MSAYLLVWSPKVRSWPRRHQDLKKFKRDGSLSSSWSCGNRRTLPVGSRVFLIKLGEEPKGIIGSGWTVSEPYPYKGRYFVDFVFDTLNESPVLSLSELQRLSSFNWLVQGSGIEMPDKTTTGLEKAWRKRGGVRIRPFMEDTQVPSAKDFTRVLHGAVLSQPQLRALQALYNFPKHSATAPQLAAVLGYKGFGGANSVMGGAGRRIAEELGVPPPWANDERQNWFSIVAEAEGTDIGCLWVMRPELATALEKTNLIDLTLGVELFPDETAARANHEEGYRFRVEVNIYERSREARKKCVAHYGTTCIACGFDFGSVYGAIGKGFIHVHHVVPLSKINQTYIVDPVRDLIPVCPNCHAMIHRREPPFSIKELTKFFKRRSNSLLKRARNKRRVA